MNDIRTYKMLMGIDPGTSGSICSMLYDPKTNSCGSLRSFAMRKKVEKKFVALGIEEIHDHLNYLVNGTTHSGHIIFIEKIQMFHSDNDVPGKAFQMQKLHNHVSQLIGAMKIRQMNCIEVPPATWQSQLGFKKFKEKKDRKNAYKDFAQQKFPSMKVNLSNADALCILEYGRRRAMYESQALFKTDI